MITIQNKKTGHTREVSQEQWKEIQGRSRNWEAVRTAQAKPPKAVKKAKPAEPEAHPFPEESPEE